MTHHSIIRNKTNGRHFRVWKHSHDNGWSLQAWSIRNNRPSKNQGSTGSFSPVYSDLVAAGTHEVVS